MSEVDQTQNAAVQAQQINGLNGHSIMLVQFSKNEETRTYFDCKTPNDMMETFCRIFENFLLNKQGIINNDAEDQMQPDSSNQLLDAEGKRVVQYQLEDILKFVDQLFDLSAMVFNQKAAGYTCHGKAWIKGMLHVYLRKLAE